MLLYGFHTACTVPLPLLGSVAPAEDLRAPKHQHCGREMLPLAEVLLQPKTCEPPDGDVSTVGAKCFRCAEVSLQSEEIRGLCATRRGVTKFNEVGAALAQDLGTDCATQSYHVAIITPEIHYCTGGLEIDKIQQCWVRIPSPFLPSTQLERLQEVCTATTDWEAILCWIAWCLVVVWEWHVRSTCWATERRQLLSRRLLVEARVRGQKSGQTSLGRNSLLDCVVYARVAGAACAKYVWRDSVKVTSLAALAGGGKGEGSKKWPDRRCWRWFGW